MTTPARTTSAPARCCRCKRRSTTRESGIEVWGQHDNTFFGLTANPGGNVLNQTETHWANSTALFLEDQYKVTSWLTLDLGIRFTHYAGLVNENAADPRVGAAIRIPRLNWTLHGYYAYYYQPPPLDSLAGPALDFAVVARLRLHSAARRARYSTRYRLERFRFADGRSTWIISTPARAISWTTT